MKLWVVNNNLGLFNFSENEAKNIKILKFAFDTDRVI
jgi:hypothetical protein